MHRAESPPTPVEPVVPCGEVDVYSLPPPYSSLPVQSYHPGNGRGGLNNSGQGSPLYKQSSIPEMSNQDNPEVVLKEGKVTLLFLQALIEN